MRRITIVFLALIFINTVVGVAVIGLLESRRKKNRTASEHSRQDVSMALQKAAVTALPTPSLVDEIRISVPPKQEEAMVGQIDAAAKQAGGSAVKNLSNENGTLVFAEVPMAHLNAFRDALAKLGAVLPDSTSATPGSGNAILQIRLVSRPE
jgi:hypothetical protein